MDIEVNLESRREGRKGRRRVADVLFDGDWLIKNHQNQIGRIVARSGGRGCSKSWAVGTIAEGR